MQSISVFFEGRLNMSGSIVLEEKSRLQSSTSQAPTTGLTAASIESAASGSVTVNASVNICSGPCCWAQHKEHRNFFFQEAAARAPWMYAVIRACFLRNWGVDSIFQSLEILQSRSITPFEFNLFHVRLLMSSKTCTGWSKFMMPTYQNFKSLAGDSPLFKPTLVVKVREKRILKVLRLFCLFWKTTTNHFTYVLNQDEVQWKLSGTEWKRLKVHAHYNAQP